MATKLCEKPDGGNSGWIIAIIIIIMLLISTAKCHAADPVKVDTMLCKTECIQKIIQQTSPKGTIRYYAVYSDPSIRFSEIIPISKSVMEYIQLCKQYSIKPTLGIKLRNGVVSGIIRYKIKFVKR